MIEIIVSNRWNHKKQKYEYGANIKSNGQIALTDIAERIQKRCTVTQSDILAVLAAFQEQAIYALRNAQSVSIGNPGNLYISAKTCRTDTPAEFDRSQVLSLQVKLRTRKNFAAQLQPGQPDVNFRVTKIESSKV